MKSVLITGATGFIGQHCLKLLLAQNYEVHALSSQKKHEDKIQWHQVDLFEKNQLASLLAYIKPTHLLHLAWYTGQGKFWNSPLNMHWVQASLGLVHYFLKEGGKRLVVAGSCAEYQWGHALCSEKTTPLLPHTYYGICKNALRTVIEHYPNIDYAWGRIFYPFGPFEKTERLIPSVINSLLSDQIAACTHGEQIRDFLYVEDVADAFVKYTFLNSTLQGPINIASGIPYKIKEICEKIATYLDKPDLLRMGALPAPMNDPAILLADTTCLIKELKWQPKWNLATALAQTIDFFQKPLCEKAGEIF